MARWAGWAKKWVAAGRSVWLAFNNDSVPAAAAAGAGAAAGEGQASLPDAVAGCRHLAAALRRNGLWS